MSEATQRPRYYAGSPLSCDLCDKPFEKEKYMYDAATHGGPWANMCRKCFMMHGRGLGLGRGQQYEKQDDGRWLKTDG